MHIRLTRFSDDLIAHKVLGLGILGFGTSDIEAKLTIFGGGSEQFRIENVGAAQSSFRLYRRSWDPRRPWSSEAVVISVLLLQPISPPLEDAARAPSPASCAADGRRPRVSPWRCASPIPIRWRGSGSPCSTPSSGRPRGVADPNFPVRIVAIDEASLAKLGQWPRPRSDLAVIVDRLAAAGAKTISFDMILAEPDRLSPKELSRQTQARPELEPIISERSRRCRSTTQRFAASIAKAPVILGLARRQHFSSGGAAEAEGRGWPPRETIQRNSFHAFPGGVASLPMFWEGASSGPRRGQLAAVERPNRAVACTLLSIGAARSPVASLLDALRVCQRRQHDCSCAHPAAAACCRSASGPASTRSASAKPCCLRREWRAVAQSRAARSTPIYLGVQSRRWNVRSQRGGRAPHPDRRQRDRASRSARDGAPALGSGGRGPRPGARADAFGAAPRPAGAGDRSRTPIPGRERPRSREPRPPVGADHRRGHGVRGHPHRRRRIVVPVPTGRLPVRPGLSVARAHRPSISPARCSPTSRPRPTAPHPQRASATTWRRR